MEKLNPRLSREMWFPFPFSIHHTCQTPRATPGEHPTFTNGKKSFRFVRAHHLLPEETKQGSFLLHRCTKGRACCTLNLARSESCNQRISQASTVQVPSAAGSSLLQPLDTSRASPELLEMDGLQLGSLNQWCFHWFKSLVSPDNEFQRLNPCWVQNYFLKFTQTPLPAAAREGDKGSREELFKEDPFALSV